MMNTQQESGYADRYLLGFGYFVDEEPRFVIVDTADSIPTATVKLVDLAAAPAAGIVYEAYDQQARTFSLGFQPGPGAVDFRDIRGAEGT